MVINIYIRFLIPFFFGFIILVNTSIAHSALEITGVNHPSNYRLSKDPENLAQLVDGRTQRHPIWTKKGALGWVNRTPLSFNLVHNNIDSDVTCSGSVSIHTGKNTNSGVNIPRRVDLYIKEKFITSVKTPLVGRYNCLNTLAVFAFFYYLGEDLEKVKQALLDFKGTKRRFEVKGKIKGVTFIDDYAHHPTEIKAVLSAGRLLNPKRLFVIFQPHRFSRVSSLRPEFVQCFSETDHLVVTDIYAASEENTFGVSAKKLAEETGKCSAVKAEYIPKNELIAGITSRLKDGDLVLALGAGDINIMMEDIRRCFHERTGLKKTLI